MAPSKQVIQAAVVAIVAKARSARLHAIPPATEARADRRKARINTAQQINLTVVGAKERFWTHCACCR